MKRNTAAQTSFALHAWDDTNTHDYGIALNQNAVFSYLDTSGWVGTAETAAADTYYIAGMMIDNDAHTANFYKERTITLGTGKVYYTRAATRSHTIDFSAYWVSGAPTVTVDWVLARKYLAVDAIWGAWGAQE